MVAIGIMVFAALLVPVVNDGVSTEKTYYNEGVPFALANDQDTAEHTIIIDSTGLTSDGVTMDATDILPGSYTIVFGEHSIFRYDPTDGRVSRGGTVAEGTAAQWGTLRNSNSDEVLTITIVGDLLTWVNGEYNGTFEDQWAYISNVGTYRYLLNPCVTSTDRIIGGGVTYSPFDSATVICFDGTIDNITGGIYRAAPAAVLNDIRVSTSEITTNLVKIDAIYFDATQGDVNKTATYTYFLAPHAISYENPDYVGDNTADVLGVLPLILICALIMGVVGYAVYQRIE